MNDSSYNHLRWEGVNSADPSALQSNNHSLVQLPGPNALQSSSLATSAREYTQPLHHQLVRNGGLFGTRHEYPLRDAPSLHTLALLAEQERYYLIQQERLFAECAQRVYMHHSNHHQLLSTSSIPQQQPFIHQIQQFSERSVTVNDTQPTVDLQKQKKTPSAVITEPTSLALSTKVPFESDKPLNDVGVHRKMGRIRYFDEHSGSYGPWKDILGGQVGETEKTTTITLNLSRGGTLRILCNILPDNKRKDLSRAMHDCKLYRQYSLSRNDRLNFVGFQEPRSHVLLSSRVKATFDDDEAPNDERRHQPGYAYHGIKMKALPINLVPEVASYAEDLARTYNLSQWDIGVDMIAYKDGGDSIGWHADDTQGETIVVCVVVDAPGEVRPLCIRPNKRKKPLHHGDEEIQLFIAEGDGYDMNGFMQENYEHSLPKKPKNMDHRFVLIFRHGDTGFVPQDSGISVLKNDGNESISGKEWNVVSAITKLRPKTESVVFGHPKSSVSVGECYSRRFLWAGFAHRADQRGISGNIKDGADSIVVSRQDFNVREEDGLSWLRYTSSRRQGGGALCMSFRTKKPVRVFRSSNLKGSYRPLSFEGDRTSYRYDGLYVVTRVWSDEGNLTDGDIPAGKGGVQFTFHLERLPHPEKNPISTDELFLRIQQSHCFGPHLPFRMPQPKNGGDVLPVLHIQKIDSQLATATSTMIQQESTRPAFQQHLSINQGARIVLESFIVSTVNQEIEGFISKPCDERKSKDVGKKEQKNKTSTQLSCLLTDTVAAIFGCVLQNEHPPQIDFRILITEGTKLTPPPFDYKEGIYALVDREFPIPHTLSDRVVSSKSLNLVEGSWTIGGARTVNSTNSRRNIRKRSMCPKGRDASKGSLAKRGALYTLIGSTGDWLDCKILHVYQSKDGKAPQVKVASQHEKETARPVIFAIKENVYAYDKGKSGNVLYDAQVIKTKKDKAGCLRYYVRYCGYKKSHNQWLSSNEIMKRTELNRVIYLNSRLQSSLTPKPSVKTNRSNLSARRLQPSGETKARASYVSKDSKKRERCSSSDIASERRESKRKRQSPARRSARCVSTFQVKEQVFAPDKKKSTDVLYEATVIKLKEEVAGCVKYLVKYDGYKKSHNQWLGAEDLMKQTKQNRVRFEESRM